MATKSKSKKLSKVDIERVRKAFAWAQKRLGTNFVFQYRKLTPEELKDDDGVIATISRTARGSDDPNHFFIAVNPDRLPKNNAALRSTAVHEVIHGVLWEVALFAEDGRKGGALASAAAANEAATYLLERAITGIQSSSHGVRPQHTSVKRTLVV